MLRGTAIQRTFSLSLTELNNADPFFSIDILPNIPSDGNGELDEILTFTLQNNLPSGTDFGIDKHTITIPANGNSASFLASRDHGQQESRSTGNHQGFVDTRRARGRIAFETRHR